MNVMVRYHPEYAADIGRLSPLEKAQALSAQKKIIDKPFKRSLGGVGKVISENASESVLTARIAGSDLVFVYKLIRSRDGESLLIIFASAVNDAAPKDI